MEMIELLLEIPISFKLKKAVSFALVKICPASVDFKTLLSNEP